MAKPASLVLRERLGVMRGVALCFTTYRWVLFNFVASDLKAKYRNSVAGYLWTLLEPLALVLTYYFLFAMVGQVGGRNYPLLVLVGVLPWTFFSNVVQGGAGALVANASLIQKVYLPRELFVMAQVASQLVVFLLSLLVVLPFLLYYGVHPSPGQLVLFPVGLALLVLLGAGLGLVFACANVLYRDVGYMLRVVLRLAMYFCPVVYAIEMVPAKYLDLYLLNPMAVALSLFQSSLAGVQLAFGAQVLGVAALVSVLVFLSGVTIFSKWESSLVKYL